MNDRQIYEALHLIADIAEGSRTANSLPNIARIARAALGATDNVPGECFRLGIILSRLKDEK